MKECPACRRCFPDHVNHCPNDGDATVHSIAGEPMLDGRYQLERRLGHGGMGVVFQARHIFLKTAHAIKVILPDLVGNDPMLVTRFRQEALAAAAIRHQNIIAVTDFGVARGTMPFLVMEFVKGKSLHDILAAEGPLSPARALEIMAAVGSGVAAAHRQNIVHRDLKPLNIMLQDDMPVNEGVKVLDFGLAKIKSGELLGSFVQAKTSGLMGSPFYMAPEQWSDEEPDVRADIYSLGVILYQMLGGDVPFKGTGIPSIMKKHLTSAPPTLSSMGVSVAPQIEAVVRHALEKDADNRPQTVEAFVAELRDAVAQTSASLDRTYVGTVGVQSETIITTTPSRPAISRPPQHHQETTLSIRTSPAYSRVYINNVSVGKSDGSGQLVVQEIQRGVHRVRVVHDGYAEWEGQIECDGGECRVDAELQSLMQTSLPQLSGDQLAGTITGAPDQMPTSSHSIEAQRLRAQAAALEEKARQEEAARREQERREQERREMEERDRIAREEIAREEEACRVAEEERLRLEAEERRKAEEEERQRAAEAERLRVEEAERLRAEAEAARKQAEAEAQERKRLEEERKRAEAEARERAEEEKRQRAEEEAARRKAEEAASQKRAEEEKLLRAEAEAARRRAEEESVARKAAEEEAARLRAEQATRKKADEERDRKRAEEERLRAEEADRLRAEAEAARKQAIAEAQERKRIEEERKRVEAETQRRIEEERKRAEAEAQRRLEEERQRLEKERLEREERERASAAERERLARELKERDEQMARMAATSIAPDMDATQQQRRGVVTQQMGENSLSDATVVPSWQQQQQQQSHPGLHQSVAPPYAPAEAKKSSMPIMLIAAVLALVVAGGGIGAYFMLSSKPAASDQTTLKTDPSKTGGGTNNSDQKSPRAEMIAIPGGTFQMGRSDGPAQEAPAHSVTVSDFLMDKTEVTNAEYAEFVNETKRTPPSHWPEGKVLAGQEQWPVNNVSLDDAKAFAAWRSKRDGVTYRLPTEEEWEYAARNGDQGNLYPWGNSWANDSAIVKAVSPQSVGTMPNGKNRWGVLDLIGNIWEWTSSKASIYPGNGRLSVPDQDKDSYVMRGGSYASEPSGERAITATFRDWVPAATKHPTLGFRLVRAGS
ncbi:MAG TPA: SUMF1/EgtB/PvdO family nonheme iron enzyme [Pyrinomonadaceae bacterium]|jgi:serine/threonine protein kinase/formylglycine-generating enzyme required for sulfatase activity|nr:SUMF1/EgtB/PvdO family nonheme iron enzyme [Pyrinomonadaceae bacterium]